MRGKIWIKQYEIGPGVSVNEKVAGIAAPARSVPVTRAHHVRSAHARGLPKRPYSGRTRLIFRSRADRREAGEGEVARTNLPARAATLQPPPCTDTADGAHATGQSATESV